ncbi:CBS domain-containing protein [Marinovum algicola]|uniref:CBS domain-containing protein n=2 Tax=Marinovum algicola TaxID=42444 RepID=A0A975WDJ9_9RHOB|nr:CBS domain-containing protein [Marinovum algicola]SEK01622.1 CBS domain-containing protein [Marinovum algicola]SLN44012.1 Hypoxic response protein 1 [Marinovum algicola]
MQVSQVMTAHPVTVTPTQNVRDAAEIMKRIDTGFVPVGDNDRLVGMVTDRDIVVKGLAAGKDADCKISEVMTHEVLYCRDDEEVAAVARNMGENQVRRLPVVDRDKRLVGIVSLGDLSSDGDPSAAGVALEQISES